jgi:hypothetical protein
VRLYHLAVLEGWFNMNVVGAFHPAKNIRDERRNAR